MIVRIARVKVGNRQAPYAAYQDPALKSGVLAFLAVKFFSAASLHPANGWCLLLCLSWTGVSFGDSSANTKRKLGSPKESLVLGA
jgi:hypothetical protein